MKNTFYKDLFERYVKGNCREDEKAMVETWYLNELRNSSYRPSHGTVSIAEQDIWNKIQAEKKITGKRSRPVVAMIRWTSIAAAISIAILFAYNFYFKTEKGVKERTFSADSPSFVTPNDENSFRKLPDGSLVILSQGSTLTLSDSFNKSGFREVKLIGKAFFDIKHNKTKPFIIYAGDISTTVLGTSFDIVANEGSDFVTVNVIRGKVSVKDHNHDLGVLTPNMQIVYDKTMEKAAVKSIDADKALSWNRQQDMSFDDVSLKEAKKLLEERFKIKIIVQDEELLNTKFSTSLGASESLAHFLHSICAFINATYIFNKNNEVSIKPLNQN